MKKRITLALAAFSGLAQAGGWDLNIEQYSADGTERIARLVPLPSPLQDSILIYDYSANLPKLATLSSCFTISSQVLNYSQACSRTSISLTTTGSGAATYNSTTGVLNVPTPSVVTPTINDNPGRSLVTATNATGFQISATRQSKGCYEGSFSTTSTIGGPASATVFLETADTNSTTPGDWTIRARQTYSNTITLAVVLNQVQTNNWTICRDIPAGKYVRLRSGSISGTASATINTEQQEVTY